MVIHKPETWKIKEPRIGGIIKKIKENQWFIFETQPKKGDLKEEGLMDLKPKINKVENGGDKYFRTPPFEQLLIRIIYLNKESANGLYKDEKNNLPYEIWSISEYLLYRQSRKEETKKEIFNRLEKAAIEEGLRNKS